MIICALGKANFFSHLSKTKSMLTSVICFINRRNFLANSCFVVICRRWNKLCKHQLPAVKAAIQLKKSVFQTNFVDRAKERPAIAPRDLIALVQSKDDGSGENIR